MPELPEVETLRLALRSPLQGRRIEAAQVRQRQLRWPVADGLEEQLTGSRIREVGRRGKYLLLETDNGTLIVHLGMSGRLSLAVAAEVSAAKHDHFVCALEGDLQLVYNDPRRFGSLHWVQSQPLQHPLLRHLGPEPLGNAFSEAYLAEQCARRRTAIKTLLMNSRIVAGVGNIYACEALFKARTRPHKACDTLRSEQIASIRHSLCAVLRQAIEAGGTSIRDFKDLQGNPGYFAQELRVYGRQGEPCSVCGAAICNRPMAGRATCFCPSCQS